MSLGFGGEVAEFYARFRRGYPPAVLDLVAAAFRLTGADAVLDLGCGTGQLTLPMAGRVRAVVGLDPEPAMLVLARQAAGAAGVHNASWLLAADRDVPALGALLGERSVGAVTIGTALHWMRPAELFPALRPLLRPGGGVAVVANGLPLWSQDTDWSAGLRGFLAGWLGAAPRASCGTDDRDRAEYARILKDAGYLDVREETVEYDIEMDADRVVGELYSAMSADRLPAPAERSAFADGVRRALGPVDRVTEHVQIGVLLGRV